MPDNVPIELMYPPEPGRPARVGKAVAPPEPEDGGRDASAFLEDIIGKQGYRARPAGSPFRGGKPSTKQEEAFILDFMSSKGRPPTLNELQRGFSRDFRASESEWLPESTMGRMGFRNWDEYLAAQRSEEPYGPWAGSLVPEGGVVVTDKSGTPYMRYMDPKRVPQKYFEQGRVIPQLEREMPQGERMRAERMGAGDVYPQYARGPFQRPGMEEVLGKYAPQQVYKARLADYLEQQVEKDAPEVQRLTDEFSKMVSDWDRRLALGDITREYFNERSILAQDYLDRKLSELMTEDKATELAQQAIDSISKGTAAEGLPLFAETQGIEGASVMALYNQMFPELEKAHQQKMGEVPEWAGYPEEEEITRQESMITGTEYADFYDYVESLDLAAEFQNWLKGQYSRYYNLWKGTMAEEVGFVPWVRSYLASGG